MFNRFFRSKATNGAKHGEMEDMEETEVKEKETKDKAITKKAKKEKIRMKPNEVGGMVTIILVCSFLMFIAWLAGAAIGSTSCYSTVKNYNPNQGSMGMGGTMTQNPDTNPDKYDVTKDDPFYNEDINFIKKNKKEVKPYGEY